MDALKGWGYQKHPDIAIRRIHRSTFCAATSVNQSILFPTLIIKRFARLSRALSDHDRRSCWTSLQLPERNTQAKSLSSERSPFSAHFQLGELSVWWGKSPSQAEEWSQVTNVQASSYCLAEELQAEGGAGRLQSMRNQRGWNIVGRTDSRTLKGSFASEHSFN